MTAYFAALSFIVFFLPIPPAKVYALRSVLSLSQQEKERMDFSP